MTTTTTWFDPTGVLNPCPRCPDSMICHDGKAEPFVCCVPDCSCTWEFEEE